MPARIQWSETRLGPTRPRELPYIQDTNGAVIGMLDLHTITPQPFFEYVPSLQDWRLRPLSPRPLSEPRELIAISRMEVPWNEETTFDMPESAYPHRDCENACYVFSKICKGLKYSCYNVLWIEWEDGIAYRKALGRVFADEWDRFATETIDVRLG
ncbi:hypothetical protein BDV95DRAFT_598542 [Massariosphaeria phaeospora]|uniref:Uncharacterized protein n=1 Tax=Massariosphaeria phaeospora TaxID=100035 RepID=A0A7C8I064_9PLEO|nr:hypothetical protein BDV95DRAFT_598542 [Massariosphaeria phaeospora]